MDVYRTVALVEIKAEHARYSTVAGRNEKGGASWPALFDSIYIGWDPPCMPHQYSLPASVKTLKHWTLRLAVALNCN